jgi:hypothetical protein
MSNTPAAKELTPFEGGATRSSKGRRFDLIPRAANEALARRLELGAEQHGENNWKQGGAEFRRATVNHLLDHIYDYIEHGNAHEANTDAIITNAAFLCHFEAEDAKALPPGFYDVQITDVKALPNGRLDITMSHKGVEMGEMFTPLTFTVARKPRKVAKKATRR